MINLLPLEEKQKLLSIKKERLNIILGIIILISLVCLTLILLSLKFYILAETDYQKNILEQAKQEYQTPSLMNLNNIIQKYNITLTQLDSFSNKEIYFYKSLITIMDVARPQGLYLSNFSLSRDKNRAVQVSVSGTSDTRNNLLIFKDNLLKESKIKNLNFSTESWISPKNVNFSLTFNIDSNEK